MKITTQQIRQIISEELNKLLYEEEDSNDVLRKALEENITDEDIDKYYQKIKDFVIKAMQDLNVQQQMQGTNRMLQSGDNAQITQVYDLFLSLINDLIKPSEEDTEKQRETKEKISKQIELFEQFLDSEDQKSFIIDRMIEIKDLREVDLIEADLSGANLSDTNLDNANLTGANLSKAFLSGANLSYANLTDADLSGADMYKANLSDTNLHEANLSKAKLSGANLRKAYLHEADLRKADLRGANLNDAYLGDANLSGALYNDDTQWPQGFDPVAAGAKKA